MAAPHSDPKAFADWYETDYFRRPRPLRRAKLWTAVAAGAAGAASLVLVAVTLGPWGRRAYQAGPLSVAHAAFADNCAACHTAPFATASRLLPGHSATRATPDTACLSCHPAAAHNAHQTRHTGTEGNAADCAACHREHRGTVALTRLDDAHCTACHAKLETNDGQHRFHAAITRFADDHPAFGAWRARPLDDPGTIRFNHKVHLELAAKLKDVAPYRLGTMAAPLARLAEQSCVACHEPDTEQRYMRPIRYDAHCASCHPLTSRPAGDWPPPIADAWAKTPLPHPQRGQTAAVVRGALLERFFYLLAKPSAPLGDGTQPHILSAGDRERAAQMARQTAARLFAADGGDVVMHLERPFFALKAGCAFCHAPSGTGATGLPEYAAPQLRERWFPHSRFSHARHRELDCRACHNAEASTATSDVLMPTIDDCRRCHTGSAAAARSDCLECHTYHGREGHGLRGQWTIEQMLSETKGR